MKNSTWLVAGLLMAVGSGVFIVSGSEDDAQLRERKIEDLVRELELLRSQVEQNHKIHNRQFTDLGTRVELLVERRREQSPMRVSQAEAGKSVGEVSAVASENPSQVLPGSAKQSNRNISSSEPGSNDLPATYSAGKKTNFGGGEPMDNSSSRFDAQNQATADESKEVDPAVDSGLQEPEYDHPTQSQMKSYETLLALFDPDEVEAENMLTYEELRAHPEYKNLTPAQSIALKRKIQGLIRERKLDMVTFYNLMRNDVPVQYEQPTENK